MGIRRRRETRLEKNRRMQKRRMIRRKIVKDEATRMSN